MAEQMRASLGFTVPTLARRVLAVDATTITEPGQYGDRLEEFIMQLI